MKPRESAKPFLKWAGGKKKLIPQFTGYLPTGLGSGQVKKYIEPFAGGGAVFFHIAQNYNCSDYIIMDKNRDLISAYKTVKKYPRELIEALKKIEKSYHPKNQTAREKYYYRMREKFNQDKKNRKSNSVKHQVAVTASLIFLNKTCYNGLYRVNAGGDFNVPFGTYSRPKICSDSNLLLCSEVLGRARIICGDYSRSADFAGPGSFFYFDPPYRPLSKSASFNSYINRDFDDLEQTKLSELYTRLSKKHSLVMLSNSNPKNTNKQDNFFHDLYGNFHIHKISALRSINSNSVKRGAISELLITNY